MKKFSVLMSVYFKEDAARFEEALKSIINQTLRPNEITLVEDGPLTSELYAVVAKYQKAYPGLIAVLSLKNNVGLGLALNAGLERCRYEYIARMDSDDISLPDRFEKQMAYINLHPDVDLVGSNIIEYDESMKQVISTRIVPQQHEDICKYMKQRNPFNHVSVIYKKQTVIDCGSYEDCLYFEDYYLWCKLAAAGGGFYNIQENLVKVRSGYSMFDRRGGLSYVGHIYNFEQKIYKLGIISTFEFAGNLVKRGVVSIIPNQWRAFIYLKVLRANRG
jgi:glycosyltransferase involved in cell wall biosynthesis